MDDLFVRDLERKFGDAGYAFWFKTLELMGAHGEKSGVLKISWRNYCDKLNKRRDHIRRMLIFSSSAGHLTFTEDSRETRNDSSEYVTITCDKFAEYADNYTRYDGVSSKRLQRHGKDTLKQEVEEEVEEEKKPNKARPKSLEDVSAYFKERNAPDESEAWWDRMEAVGWKVGRNPVADWKASVRTWIANSKKWGATKRRNENRQNAGISPLMMSEMEARRESHA